jgi:hypothetical protein
MLFFTKPFFDRFYLCVYDNKMHHISFKCEKFNTFYEADFKCKLYNRNKNANFWEARTTIVSVCAFVPKVFDKYILDWKLKKIFWIKPKITKI